MTRLGKQHKIKDKLPWPVQRWLYRRMAWKDDQSLWMDMHPHIACVMDRLYEHSWPLRDWWYSLWRAAQRHQGYQAYRDVYGYSDSMTVRNDYYDGDRRTATEIYADARQKGWTGRVGQSKKR